MKYIKTYEEIKYTSDHIKLVKQARYKLNKFFGCNCCGINKHRVDFKNDHYAGYTIIDYTGSTMIFDISIPSFIHGNNIENYDIKIEKWKKFADSLGLKSRYSSFDDPDREATEEQLKKLVSMMPYIDIMSDVEKYNL